MQFRDSSQVCVIQAPSHIEANQIPGSAFPEFLIVGNHIVDEFAGIAAKKCRLAPEVRTRVMRAEVDASLVRR
eukprot:4708478-Pyramimonas_sp.AAC.1